MTSPSAAAAAVARSKTKWEAAGELGISRHALRRLLKKAAFEVEKLPDFELPVDDLIEQRKKAFNQRMKASKARAMVNIAIKDKKPIGLVFFGDPHVDDDGCDLAQLFLDAETVRDTEGMWGMNQGDNQNNWVGRLERLYANQTTTASQGWMIAEKFLRTVPWMALVRGNHDHWVGAGDPTDWIMRGSGAVDGAHDVKLALNFPNGRQVRIWMRHDFQGHSQWNMLHGLGKAALMGNDFHIFSAGHKHIAGHHFEFSPEMGHFWHALRVSGYKVMDDYAPALNLRATCQLPAAAFIIDPNAKDEKGLVRFDECVQGAADRLTWMRSRA